MPDIFNINNFWNRKSYTTQQEIDTLYERKKKLQDFTLVQKVLGSPFQSANSNIGYFDILKEKVVSAQNATISETQNKTRQLQSLLTELKGEGALSSNEDLSDDAQAIQQQINYQSQVKFLQMYFDAYMAPKVSDIEWRLGKTTGTVLLTDGLKTGQLPGGLMYTRSQFSFPFYRSYWEYDIIGDTLANTDPMLFGMSGLYGISSEIQSMSQKDKNDYAAGYTNTEGYQKIASLMNSLSYNIDVLNDAASYHNNYTDINTSINSIRRVDNLTSYLRGISLTGINDSLIENYYDNITKYDENTIKIQNNIGKIYNLAGLYEDASGLISFMDEIKNLPGFATIISNIRVGELNKSDYDTFISNISGLLLKVENYNSFIDMSVETIYDFKGYLENYQDISSVNSVSDGTKALYNSLSTLTHPVSEENVSTYLNNTIQYKDNLEQIREGLLKISGVTNYRNYLSDLSNKANSLGTYAEFNSAISNIKNYINSISTLNLYSSIQELKKIDEIEGTDKIFGYDAISGLLYKLEDLSGYISSSEEILSSASNLSNIKELYTSLAGFSATGINASEIVSKVNDIAGTKDALENVTYFLETLYSVSGIYQGTEPYLSGLNYYGKELLSSYSDTLMNNFKQNLSSISTILNDSLEKPNLGEEKFDGITGIKQKKEYYSSMFFPPYKISPETGIGDYTQFMSDIYARNPTAEFDIDSFLLRKEGMTYRDPGCKSISDYINYLQWIIEGTTGVVHTYLTEWDLSLYMQQNMIAATINGAPTKLYLNYRIRKDNPLATTETVPVVDAGMSTMDTNLFDPSASKGKYTDDRALVFNVVGSAVSKIERDNNKLYRPSDHPLSVWWLPYMRERDWNMKVLEVENHQFHKIVPYMDIYDTVNSRFSYENSSLRDIFKNQDYLGAIMGTWPNWGMKYFQAFYTSPLDGHTDWDVRSYVDLNSVVGAEPGVAAAKNKGLDDFVTAAKEEMLLNEGYYGTAQAVAGMKNRDQWISQGMEEGDSKITMSDLAKKQKKAAEQATAGVDLDQPFAGAQDKANSYLNGLDLNVDASSMTNFTGMNRFSPMMFGGPHGSDYNPNTVQGYFDTRNIFLRNIARIDTYQAKDSEKVPFRSLNQEDYYTGSNSFYDTGTQLGMSPARGLNYLMDGLTIYTIDYANMEVERIGEWIPISDRDNLPIKTKQGYNYDWFIEGDQRLVNIRDKRIEKEEILTKRYSYNPYTMNDILTGKVINMTQVNGFYVITFRQLYKRASYIEIALTPYKKYITYDKPELRWEIVQHKFEKYTAPLEVGSEYWQAVTQAITDYSLSPSKLRKQLNVLANQYKPLFILKFWQDQSTGTDNEHDPEKDIVENIVSKGRFGQAVKIFFLQGNEAERFETGPECIFTAPLTMDYYKDVQENFVETSLFRVKKKVKTGESYRYHSFIKVDMANSDIIADNLQFNGFTNKLMSGVATPMHLNSVMTNNNSVDVHALQKFKSSNSLNSIISFKTTKVTKAGFFTSLVSRIVEGVDYVVNKAAEGITYALDKVGLVQKESIGTLSVNMNSAVTGFLTKGDDADYDPTLDQTTNWISTSFRRLSGIGLMTQFKGLNPNIKNIEVFPLGADSEDPPSAVFPFKNELTLPSNSRELEFKDIQFASSLGPVDAGLSRALLNIYIRPRFIIEDTAKLNYAYVTLDTIFRNFLSVMLTQISYFKFVKSSIIGESSSEGLVNFDVLWKTLTTCVDKCILKASGLNSLNQRVQADRNHIMYDYWMEQIINILYGNDIDRQAKKIEISTQLQQKIDIMQSAIDIFHPLCKKDAINWTFNEVIEALNTMEAVKSVTSVTILEKFLFGYLRILYYYRFFFLAKRFNKENGTMWIMRALESVLEFIVPSAPPSGPPPSPGEMTKKEPVYNVAFYELQNTTEAKQKAIINKSMLDPDRITKVYVRVNWGTEADYNRYQDYVNGVNTIEYDEVVKIIHHDDKTNTDITKYAFKPVDGLYTLISTEYLDNQKNIKWNNLHPLDIQRTVYDYDTTQWDIVWGDTGDKTPIRWNVFGEVDINNMLNYAKESISPDEMMCLIEQGADFWTVSIPESSWPRAEGFRSRIKIKQYAKINADLLITEPSITIEGPMAFTVYPITQKQERPVPGIATDNPAIFELTNRGLGGY
jgi:hypothetical protein